MRQKKLHQKKKVKTRRMKKLITKMNQTMLITKLAMKMISRIKSRMI
jgi:hypothetical protein